MGVWVRLGLGESGGWGEQEDGAGVSSTLREVRRGD